MMEKDHIVRAKTISNLNVWSWEEKSFYKSSIPKMITALWIYESIVQKITVDVSVLYVFITKLSSNA